MPSWLITRTTSTNSRPSALINAKDVHRGLALMISADRWRDSWLGDGSPFDNSFDNNAGGTQQHVTDRDLFGDNPVGQIQPIGQERSSVPPCLPDAARLRTPSF